MELLVERQLRTIAFPCISTGIYGYHPSEAADVAASTVREFLESEAGKDIEMVAFVMFESKDWNAYKDVIPYVYPNLPRPMTNANVDTIENISHQRRAIEQDQLKRKRKSRLLTVMLMTTTTMPILIRSQIAYSLNYDCLSWVRGI